MSLHETFELIAAELVPESELAARREMQDKLSEPGVKKALGKAEPKIAELQKRIVDLTEKRSQAAADARSVDLSKLQNAVDAAERKLDEAKQNLAAAENGRGQPYIRVDAELMQACEDLRLLEKSAAEMCSVPPTWQMWLQYVPAAHDAKRQRQARERGVIQMREEYGANLGAAFLREIGAEG